MSLIGDAAKWAPIIGDLVADAWGALAGKPDLDAFKQAALNAERRISDELARKELGGDNAPPVPGPGSE